MINDLTLHGRLRTRKESQFAASGLATANVDTYSTGLSRSQTGDVAGQVNHLYFTCPTGVRGAILKDDFMNRFFWNQEWRHTVNSGDGADSWQFGYGVGKHTYFEMPETGELGFAKGTTGLSVSVASHEAGLNLVRALTSSFPAAKNVTTEAKLAVTPAPGEPQTYPFKPFQRDFYEFGVDTDAQGKPAFSQRVEMWAQEERRLDGKPGVPSREKILQPHYDPSKMFKDFQTVTIAVAPVDMPTVDAMLMDEGFKKTKDGQGVLYHPSGKGTDIVLLPGTDSFQGLVQWTGTLNQDAVRSYLRQHPGPLHEDFGGGVSLSVGKDHHGRYIADFVAQQTPAAS